MNDKDNITPIEDISYNEEIIMIPDEEDELKITPISNKQPKNSKVGTVLVILLFVFLFGFVMGIPYINEYIEKAKNKSGLSDIEQEAINLEKKQNTKTPTKKEEKIETKELVCTSSNVTIDNYSVIKTQKFNYDSNNQVLSSSLIVNYIFTKQDDYYKKEKERCDNDTLKYVNKVGFTMSCSTTDNDIEFSYTYDLETFQPIIEDTNIQVNAVYKQNIDTLKDNLLKTGYKCQ